MFDFFLLIFAQNKQMMNMRLTYATFLVVTLSFLVISCQTTPDDVVLALSQVEGCMEAYPDSALKQLKRIPNPESLRGKAQADYALLMTQAMDKNYMKPTSDSLISLAVGYYGAHDMDVKAKGKSFFYFGRVMSELRRYEDAMKYFLASKEIFEGSKEYKMLGLISEEIGNLNWKQDMFEEALSNYQKSKKYSVLSNDTLGISYALRNMGRTYLSLNSKSDSAYIFYQQALQIAHKYDCSSEFAILQELGMIYRARKDYKKSEFYLLQSLEIAEKEKYFSGIYLSLGYTYLKMKNEVEADKYLKLGTRSLNIFTQVDAYNSLYRLEKSRHNLKSAIEYKEISDSLSRVSQSLETKKIIAELQGDYENEKLQKENLQIKIEYKNVLIFSLILFFIILLLVCYYVYKNRITKRRTREIEQTIAENEAKIASYQQDMVDYKKQQNQSAEYQLELATEVAQLDGKVSLLSKLNIDLNQHLKEMRGGGHIPVLDLKIEEPYVRAFRIYLSLRRGVFNTEISYKDWGRLFELFDLLYADFVKRLKEEFPQLTKHDFEICCLLKIELSHDELRQVFSTTSESVTKAKGRLKKRLLLSAKDDLEQFVYKY